MGHGSGRHLSPVALTVSPTRLQTLGWTSHPRLKSWSRRQLRLQRLGSASAGQRGRMGTTWADWGGLGTRGHILLAPLSVEEHEPRRPAPSRQRTARTERLSGPQVSLETRVLVRTGRGRPPAQLRGSQRLEPSSHLGSRFPS